MTIIPNITPDFNPATPPTCDICVEMRRLLSEIVYAWGYGDDAGRDLIAPIDDAATFLARTEGGAR